MATNATVSTSIRSKAFVHQHCQRRTVQIAGPGVPGFRRGRLLPSVRPSVCIMQVRGELQDSVLCHALTAVANAEAGASSSAEPGRFTSSAEDEQRLAERTVMCYGIPWSMEPDEGERWLIRQCSVLKDEITHIQLRRFGDDKALQAQYPENSKHTGYAHIALRSSESVSTLVDVISEQELDGRALKALPASDTRKLLPPGWFDTIGYLEGGEEWVKEQERLKAERERKHADQVRHNRNRRRRRKEQHHGEVKEVVQKLINPFTGKRLSEPSHVQLDMSAEPVDGSSKGGEALDWSSVWDEMPAPCDPARGGRLCKASMAAASVKPVPMRKRSAVKQQKRMESAAASGGGGGPIRLGGVSARAERKRVQVASFAVVLRQILGGWQGEEGGKSAMIVDFGCGSGNLLLPLAALFPKCTFIGVDMKKVSVELLNERAKDSGLGNVSGVVGSIEDYEGDFDVALGLHACGMATDHAMDKAMARSAAYVMCPCCVGKLKFGLQGRGGAVVLTNAPNGGGEESDMSDDGADGSARGGPRSSWLRDSIELEEFATLATAADLSHADGHGYYEWAEQAKTCIELDRNKAAQDSSYQTVLTKLLGVDKDHFVNKSDILVGAPTAKIASGDFKWPWEL